MVDKSLYSIDKDKILNQISDFIYFKYNKNFIKPINNSILYINIYINSNIKHDLLFLSILLNRKRLFI